MNVQWYQNAYHNHGMDHVHGMWHEHYIDHLHYTGGTTVGSDANITIDGGQANVTIDGANANVTIDGSQANITSMDGASGFSGNIGIDEPINGSYLNGCFSSWWNDWGSEEMTIRCDSGSDVVGTLHIEVGNHTHGIYQSDHSHGVTQTNHSHGVTQTNHSHGVTQTNHTHDWGNWSGAAYAGDRATSMAYSHGPDWRDAQGNPQDRSYTDGATKNGVARNETDYSGDVNVQESRPRNLTIRIWKRVA